MTIARIALLLALLLPFQPATVMAGEQTPVPGISVYKSPSCGCCGNWVKYMQEQGFDVTVTEMEDVAPIKRELGVPEQLESCHTSKIGNYFIEGHVPAEDIRRLLTEQPEAKGLAAAGMPMTAPGMDVPGATDPYEVTIVKADGSTEVFSRH